MTFELEWRKLTDQCITYLKKDRSLQIGLAVAVVGVFVGGGYYGYRWWRVQREEKAQLAFADSFDAYGQALGLQFKKEAKAAEKKEMWEQVDIDFKHSVQQNSHSSLAPFFKAFQAQALSYEGNRAEALATMREAVKKFSSKNPYHDLYEISLALMLLDGNESEVAEGVKLLERIGDDAKNKAQDMALYYLGLYSNSVGEFVKAAEYWQKVIALPVSEEAQSPWRQLAEIKLADLGHKKL